MAASSSTLSLPVMFSFIYERAADIFPHCSAVVFSLLESRCIMRLSCTMSCARSVPRMSSAPNSVSLIEASSLSKLSFYFSISPLSGRIRQNLRFSAAAKQSMSPPLGAKRST